MSVLIRRPANCKLSVQAKVCGALTKIKSTIAAKQQKSPGKAGPAAILTDYVGGR